VKPGEHPEVRQEPEQAVHPKKEKKPAEVSKSVKPKVI
jgi:hypothetical protein